MSKTACKVQCPQCPFRPSALRGWLGDYTPESIPPLLWRNIPFLCHTKVNYNDQNWESRAMASGKLCLGSLAMAAKMRAGNDTGRYPEEEDVDVITARNALTADDLAAIECMRPMDFVRHHNHHSTLSTDSMKSTRKNIIKTKKPLKPRPATAVEIAAEIVELKRLAPLIRQQDAFGGDNRRKIEVEIEALENDYSEEDCHDHFGPTQVDYNDETEEGIDESTARDIDCDERRSDEVVDSALCAIHWRDGEVADKPSDGWSELYGS